MGGYPGSPGSRLAEGQSRPTQLWACFPSDSKAHYFEFLFLLFTPANQINIFFGAVIMSAELVKHRGEVMGLCANSSTFPFKVHDLRKVSQPRFASTSSTVKWDNR